MIMVSQNQSENEFTMQERLQKKNTMGDEVDGLIAQANTRIKI